MALPKPSIEAGQSVLPTTMTDPRLSCRVSVGDSAGSGIFRRRFHVILYYEKMSSQDSGWFLAGWTRESLGRALEEQPILAGRMRREEGGPALEIVSNDSGIRLFEARFSGTLAEFLDSKGRGSAESEPVYWKDIEEEDPRFSPLFYVQVTNFQCGGYSVGVSCSLLLADPLSTMSFLRRWSTIHRKMISETNASKLPIFYLPNLKPNGSISSSTTLVGSVPTKNTGKSVIFKAMAEKLNPDSEMHKALALLCIEEAESKLGVKMGSKFSLLVKESLEEIKVEEDYLREGLMQKPSNFIDGLDSGSWDELGAGEICFYEGNKPVCASFWIDSSVPGEGLVVLIPSHEEGVSKVNVIVTISNEIEM